MNTNIIIQAIGIVGFILFIIFPFDKRRIRAQWAKFVFVISGLLGIIMLAVYMMLDTRCLVIHNQTTYKIVHMELAQTGGIILGFIFSLIFSGQLTGTKRTPNTALEPTAAAL
jgi:hypothetical protein